MIRQAVNQTKAHAIEAAQEIASEHGIAYVWRSGRFFWASVTKPHPDSVAVHTAQNGLHGALASPEIALRLAYEHAASSLRALGRIDD